MNRRGFLKGILLAAAAPAIVRAGSLMRIVPRPIYPVGFDVFAQDSVIVDQLRDVVAVDAAGGPDLGAFCVSFFCREGKAWVRHIEHFAAKDMGEAWRRALERIRDVDCPSYLDVGQVGSLGGPYVFVDRPGVTVPMREKWIIHE